MGVELGDVFTENDHNRKGNRENSRIVFLNEAVLMHNHASWDKPRVVEHWTKEMARERDSIISELTHRNSAHWGFKDTRTLFTLPFWAEALQTPAFIGTFRHPMRVALSLQNRDGAEIDESLELWCRYNEQLLSLASEHQMPLVNFDDPPDDYLDSTIRKLLSLGLEQNRVAQAREFFDPGLRNQTSSGVNNSELPEAVQKIYADLLDYPH